MKRTLYTLAVIPATISFVAAFTGGWIALCLLVERLFGG